MTNQLLEVAIEITSACNLNCQICLINKRKDSFLSFEEIKKVVNEARSLGVEGIRITGGEPLLHNNIKKILKYIKSKNFYLILNTNGILLNSQLIKELEKYLDNILVSLQGYNSLTEKRLTGKNYFKDKIRNLAKLVNSNIDIIRIDTIISQTLLKNLEKYKLILTTLGVKTWVVNRPMFNQGQSPNKEYDISKNDLLKIMDFMLELKKIGINANLGNSIPFCITSNLNKIKLLTANAMTEGYRRIVYNVDKFYKPTYKINFNLGKTLKQALKNPFMKKIQTHKYLPNKCQNCKYLQGCLGGSRFLAQKSNGNYFGADPWIEK